MVRLNRHPMTRLFSLVPDKEEGRDMSRFSPVSGAFDQPCALSFSSSSLNGTRTHEEGALGWMAEVNSVEKRLGKGGGREKGLRPCVKERKRGTLALPTHYTQRNTRISQPLCLVKLRLNRHSISRTPTLLLKLQVHPRPMTTYKASAYGSPFLPVNPATIWNPIFSS